MPYVVNHAVSMSSCNGVLTKWAINPINNSGLRQYDLLKR